MTTVARTTARKKGRKGTPMKLVLAIVQSQDADRITETLVSMGFPGPTRINTVGGFLRRGNVTLLLGTEKERVDQLIEVVREHAEARADPSQPEAHRATIFVLHANRLLRV
ncbi:MAG: hypothetical protein CL878_08285 [Dehalococcoidia bacterium]|nr:hypothetical protein [Dehalococcoidia bacterium]